MYEAGPKRLLDIVLSASALLLLAPLLLLTALAIKLDDGGPILFIQGRVGRNDTHFRLFKFRSMPVGTRNLPSASAGLLTVTRVGRWIRRGNIDELPQLLNILHGDMSVVGPRPALPSQEELLALRRQSGASKYRPGLTGAAQVNAYDNMPDQEKADWDGRYAKSVSFANDLGIILRTFTYLLRPPPAY